MAQKNVFIAPASREQLNKAIISTEAFKVNENFLSIQGVIPIENIADTLNEEEKERLEVLYPDKKVRIWGTRSGGEGVWKSLAIGDQVVFYSKNYYIFTAEAVYKTINEKLARKVWGEYKTGELWKFIFFLDNVHTINFGRKDFNRKLGYNENFVPRGFMRIANINTGEELEELLKFESVIPFRRWWFEKTIVKGRTDREKGEYSLGKALWSPQKRSDGRDIYRNMRQIKRGDLVLHLINSKEIVGISTVEKECDSTFYCLPGTQWDDGTGKRPGYLVVLRDYQKLETPIDRSEVLNEKNQNRLINLLEQGHYLFYNRNLELNQGAYLTEAPPPLVEIINEVYKGKTGKDLPQINLAEDNFTFKLTKEDFEACREAKKTNYIKTVKDKFENKLKPELTHALGTKFKDFLTTGKHRSPYTARVWTRLGGGHYRGNMWIGFAHKKFEDPRNGIQFQFGINKDYIFSLGLWIEGKGLAPKARKKVKERIVTNKRTFLDLLHELGDNYRINAWPSGGNEINEKANEVTEEEFDDWTSFVEDYNYYFQIFKEISKEKAIGIGTSIVGEIATSFSELRPLYNLFSGIHKDFVSKPFTEMDQIIVAHLITGRNIIFYGPPGTGKTRNAVKITKLFCGDKLDSFSFVTANAEWTAYDVVGGPTFSGKTTLKIKPGFLSLAARKCSGSLKNSGVPYWLIIDEINRANLDLAFGKVFSLLDVEYRDQPIFDESELVGMENAGEYHNTTVPPSFRILATMNTYDTALLFSLGYAFRRRFAFVEVASPFIEDEVEKKYELNEKEWRKLKLSRQNQFEDIAKEIDNWILGKAYLQLSSELKENLGRPKTFDLAEILRQLNKDVIGGKLDPFNPYTLACKLSEEITQKGIVEIGYAQAVDVIKFTLIYAVLFPEDDKRVTVLRALDEALKAYFLPNIEYYLPRARRKMTIGEKEDEEEAVKKLEDFEAFIDKLGLIRSQRKMRGMISRLQMGETRIF